MLPPVPDVGCARVRPRPTPPLNNSRLRPIAFHTLGWWRSSSPPLPPCGPQDVEVDGVGTGTRAGHPIPLPGPRAQGESGPAPRGTTLKIELGGGMFLLAIGPALPVGSDALTIGWVGGAYEEVERRGSREGGIVGSGWTSEPSLGALAERDIVEMGGEGGRDREVTSDDIDMGD